MTVCENGYGGEKVKSSGKGESDQRDIVHRCLL